LREKKKKEMLNVNAVSPSAVYKAPASIASHYLKNSGPAKRLSLELVKRRKTNTNAKVDRFVALSKIRKKFVCF
jgi:hypothetical protein